VASINQEQTQPEISESHIAAILEHRYGDGMAYLPRTHPAKLMALARQRGFIDTEGYLTRKGRALLARHH
jgi:hypothetical protein